MSSLQARLDKIPEGSAALFFIQMFSTLGYAVLQTSLVLYATKHLNFSDNLALSLMSLFGAFNYGLHLFGGYLGGRFLSNRNLFVGGMVLQVLGCGLIATGSGTMLYWGLSLFLTGSGLNVTCINMMLTQRFTPDDPRREGAFLWNYAGMNVGFFVGILVAGLFNESGRWGPLFTFATLGNLVAIVLAVFYWRVLKDRETPLLHAGPDEFRTRGLAGLAILVGLVPVVWALLQHPDSTTIVVEVVCAMVFLALGWVTLKHPVRRERRNMSAYLVLAVGSLVFWSLYQIQPSGLTLFFDRNVDPMVFGIAIQPQWVQNINTIVIVLCGPLLASVFTTLRERGWRIDVPKQFATAVVLMGLGYLALPVGISLADPVTGRSAFVWIFLSYVLQSLGELLISPVGYAMIGKLAPHRYQGVMMGAWMLLTGLASVFAGQLSKWIPSAQGAAPQVTNTYYSMLFGRLGWGTVAVGIVLALLIPFLRRLISDKDTPEVDELAPAVMPH
ncbi:MAG: MFS transporter [Caulobacter sp.]|nr:MFS transporter [Vitreoscilla sp.]